LRHCPCLAALVLISACAGTPGAADFARWDATLRAEGKLRADRAPIDAPFGRRDIVENFAKIGFGSEFEIVGGRYVPLAHDAEAPLTRWEGPVDYALVGDFREADAETVARFAGRLGRATGVAIRPAGEGDADLMIFVLDAESRAALGRRFAGSPDYAPLRDLYDAWAGDPAWPCAAEFYFTPPDRPGAYAIYFAVVYIRAELSGISRVSCFEEEIAQTMGLARDDPTLRPSIFNDDEEFALMTEHDAALLSVLYDPRLEPGMRLSEAMPIVRRIVAEMPLGPASCAGEGGGQGCEEASKPSVDGSNS
jgi:hypothetical protein